MTGMEPRSDLIGIKRLLDMWALRRLTRHLDPDENTVAVLGVEYGGGRWLTYRSINEAGGRPRSVWGIPPKVVGEWNGRELKRWLRDHQ